MKRNLLLLAILVLWSSTWIVLFLFFFDDKVSHLLPWTNSFKDETQPALVKIRYSKSIQGNVLKFSSKKQINKEIFRKKGRELRRRQKGSFNHEVLLKRFTYNFKTEFCRIYRAKLNWKKYLAPCAKHTKWEINSAGWKNRKLKTCAANSFISKWDIRPAGEFSRFFIQSKTSNNHTKNIGGDSWRVHIKGSSSVSATVFDHNNGVYEVLFLLMEAGLYQIEITLDYTLCDGFKDPPAYWYKKGSYQGKNQPDGILQGDRPYLMEPLGDGKRFFIDVQTTRYSKKVRAKMDKIRKKFFTLALTGKPKICDVHCPSLVFDGLGRWIDRTWEPFSHNLHIRREPHNGEGMLWMYGDSVSKRFAENLVTGPYRELCKNVFKRCRMSYSWVYNVENVKDEDKLDGEDYDHQKVLAEINRVLEDQRLDKHSVVMLNWGIHFAAAVSFTNYKKLIDDFLEMLKSKKRQKIFEGEIIWRTTTAIFRERYTNPHKDVRRFLTFPRIILYNAYAMSAMCKAGIDVVDVYPMTDSFPPGTVSKRDPVHFERIAMESVQRFVYNKFKSQG
ncbi:uncharacterized protein LOC114526330 [Dendronephthya gigantea]|uniref:uncharacterized protein LOC114526330 n=1 Tax=Dendronephthya gigantea TaxID=151771 RepID=UPI00106A3820|nr:uncharacterized protein LOC114526330 [Dendronephthya gigantea]